jgi:hypothetical protein
MLATKNTKLGNGVVSWNLPAKSTCPGASEACKAVCYATKGFHVFKIVKRSQERNKKLWRSKEWVDTMVQHITKRYKSIKAVRIHSSGDFYTKTYIQKWISIVKRCPWVKFYAYTRSWMDPKLKPLLIQLSRLPNMFLWFSGDHSMPAPPKVRGVKRAYMRVNEEDHPKWKADLLFNELSAVFEPRKKLDSQLICPAEQRVARKVKMTCAKCKICFN